jgi:hypothetical protein
MTTQVLTDVAHGLWVDSFVARERDFDVNTSARWTVTKQTLRGGRRDGVDLIEIDNGAFAFSVVPTRGMGIWKGSYEGRPIGWESPVRDGPVNPAFVNLLNNGGLGWLEGFDELLARCGLENNGAPFSDGRSVFGLHGKLANTPAHFVSLHFGEPQDPTITVEGHIDESRLFSTQIRMITEISTKPGSNTLAVRDTFRNLGDLPQDMQILYHWNFGPPYLGEGATFVAAAKAIVPRDARAVEGIGHIGVYGGPELGFAEQVYYYDLLANSKDLKTLVLLRDRAGENGLVLRFDRSKLPAFTLWKNTGGRKSGYVTGLEPGSNYPNPRPFEQARGRVLTLQPEAEYVTETTLEVLTTSEAVRAAEIEINQLQELTRPMVHTNPLEPFAPAN